MKTSPRFVILAAALSLGWSALASPEPPAVRLPGDVVPRHAALDLTIRPADPAYTGTAVYEVDLKNSLDLLRINARGLTIQKAVLAVSGEEKALRVVPGGEELAGLALAAPAGPGTARLTLTFSGKLSENDTRGLFREKDGDVWYAFSHFEPIDARRAFPCFDEPSFKIPWRLTLHVPTGDLAVSNTPQETEKDEPGGMKAVAFAETKPLPSYLVALGVGPFDVVDAGKLGAIPLRIIVPKGAASKARYAAATIAPLLGVLEDYFGIPYPYEKLDALAVPTTVGFGAMENAGLITYAAHLILAKPEDEGIEFRRDFASVAAHEMAHMWFGDLVTMGFWDDLWLNESFASWMGSKTVERFKPEWNERTEKAASRNHAMGADSLVTARRIRQPIVTQDDIANAFDGITYGKGEAVLTMFEAWMGEEPFRHGVQRYLKAHAYGNAATPDFLAALAAEEHPEVPAAFSSFLDQAGAPAVTVSLSCGADGAKLVWSQKRLVPLGSASAAPQLWQIPICARYASDGEDARQCALVSGASGELPLTSASGCPAWILANDGADGYYRTAYGGDLLKKLFADARLSEPEKVALIGDARALASTGIVPITDALALVPSLARDGDRFVVESLAGLVSGIKERGLPAAELPAFGRFVGKTFGARARALGFAPKAGEGEETRLLRGVLVPLVALDGRDEALRGQALSLARKWLAEHGGVDPDLLPSVLEVAADAGDPALFDAYLAAARKEKERRERVMLLRKLGAFRDPKLAARALEVTLSPEFDARDVIGVFWSQLEDERTRPRAFAFVEAHWDQLIARLPQQMRGWLPEFGASFCDEAGRAEVDAFLTPRVKGFEGAPRNLAQALEGIKVCSAVRTAQAPAIKEFLARY